MKRNKIIFLIGVLVYIYSFFLPTIQFSLGVQLMGWESVLIQWSEILVVSSTLSYIKYLFIALTNFWVVGLIIGGLVVEQKRYKVILAGLAFVSLVSWLFLFNDNSVILYGYYVWSLSVCLIIIGRFLKN